MLWPRSAIVFAALLLASSGCCVQRCGGMNCDSGLPCSGGQCACDDGCRDTCDNACGSSCGLLSPLHCLLGCGSGCGEFYYDEWLSDPPQCCDPCDNCGNW